MKKNLELNPLIDLEVHQSTSPGCENGGKLKKRNLSLQHAELFSSNRRDQGLPKNQFLKGIIIFKQLLYNCKGGGHTACTYVDFQELNYENITLLHAEKKYVRHDCS